MALVLSSSLQSAIYSCPHRTGRVSVDNSVNNDASLQHMTKSQNFLPFCPSSAMTDALLQVYMYLAIYSCCSQWFLCYHSYTCTCHDHRLKTTVCGWTSMCSHVKLSHVYLLSILDFTHQALPSLALREPMNEVRVAI